jgi:hypothetical protein
MAKQASVRLSEPEIHMLRRAMRIAGEDGSLIAQTGKGDAEPAEAEWYERIIRKLNEAMDRIKSNG